jgi:hypothetical protein
MRSLFAAAALVLSALAPLTAADTGLGTCDTSVGQWEFATQPGRALIAKEEGNFEVFYLTQFTDPTSGTIVSDGSASECTCEGAASKLTWTCHVRFALRPDEIGATETYEWTVEQGILKSWSVAPDGQRGRGIAIRRPK